VHFNLVSIFHTFPKALGSTAHTQRAPEFFPAVIIFLYWTERSSFCLLSHVTVMLKWFVNNYLWIPPLQILAKHNWLSRKRVLDC